MYKYIKKYFICKWTYNDGGIVKTSKIQQVQGRLNLEADSLLVIKCLNSGGVSLWKTMTIGGTAKVNIGGSWKKAIPYVKVNDSWKPTISYIKANSNWKRGQF